MRSLLSVSVLVFAVAGCGSDADQPADAAPSVDASTLPVGCDYAELRDLTNDDVAPATGTPEMTGLTFSTHTVLCGTLDNTHFDGDITVDVDGFVVSVASEADVLVTIQGAGAAALTLVGADIYTGASLEQFVGSSTYYGDHGVTSLHLAAGTYEVAVFGLDAAAPAAPIPYKIQLTAAGADRCPALTTGGYAETADGSAHDGNDVIQFMASSPPALTTSVTDLPEPTQLVLAPAVATRITGSAAAATVADQYEDRDTFALTTGDTTNELTIRLDWPGTTADLDYFMFEADTTDAFSRAIKATKQAPELTTFSVKPNTAYWLLVGAKVGSTGLPASYSATLCGATFTP